MSTSDDRATGCDIEIIERCATADQLRGHVAGDAPCGQLLVQQACRVGHETSPSADGSGELSVGERPVADGYPTPSATEGGDA